MYGVRSISGLLCARLEEKGIGLGPRKARRSQRRRRDSKRVATGRQQAGTPFQLPGDLQNLVHCKFGLEGGRTPSVQNMRGIWRRPSRGTALRLEAGTRHTGFVWPCKLRGSLYCAVLCLATAAQPAPKTTCCWSKGLGAYFLPAEKR